jgi:hypothetical protein
MEQEYSVTLLAIEQGRGYAQSWLLKERRARAISQSLQDEEGGTIYSRAGRHWKHGGWGITFK